MTLTVFGVGTRVGYGPDFRLEGEVNQVTVGRDGRVEYQVLYFAKGEPQWVWLHAELVRPLDRVRPLALGFHDTFTRAGA